MGSEYCPASVPIVTASVEAAVLVMLPPLATTVLPTGVIVVAALDVGSPGVKEPPLLRAVRVLVGLNGRGRRQDARRVVDGVGAVTIKTAGLRDEIAADFVVTKGAGSPMVTLPNVLAIVAATVPAPNTTVPGPRIVRPWPVPAIVPASDSVFESAVIPTGAEKVIVPADGTVTAVGSMSRFANVAAAPRTPNVKAPPTSRLLLRVRVVVLFVVSVPPLIARAPTPMGPADTEPAVMVLLPPPPMRWKCRCSA